MTNKRTLADWFLATRPWSYPASTMPVASVLAYYFADGVAVDPVNAVWALSRTSSFSMRQVTSGATILTFGTASTTKTRWEYGSLSTVSSWPGSSFGLQFSFFSLEHCVRSFSFGERDCRFWR